MGVEIMHIQMCFSAIPNIVLSCTSLSLTLLITTMKYDLKEDH